MANDEFMNVIQLVIEEIWNQGSLDLADLLFTKDYVNHGGLIPDLVQGPEAIKFSVAMYRLAFPALQIAIDELAIEGEMATLRWSARGAPMGTERLLAGVTFGRFAGHQIAESWTHWDADGEGNRLGLIPISLDLPTGACRETNPNGFAA
jgi:predicted SnoaL-like aldol condensation-catalyzing enzyme